ncbi:CC0125/CC1285 family lipoprotein [Bradyrhizobium manausense]
MLVAVAAILVSCSTPYQQQSFTGGSDVKELRPDVFRVSFQGNGYTTRESVQVYWLYRAAQLAVEKGFAGFELLSDIQFVMRRPPADYRSSTRLSSAVPSLRTLIPVSPQESAAFRIWDRGDLASRSDQPIRLARGGAVFIYTGGGAAVPKPGIEADVHFLPAPVEAAPPKVFNAKTLLAQLEPLIKAERCNLGNICPHVHEYLLPKGTLR